MSAVLLLMGVGGGAMVAKAIRGVGEARESGSWTTVAGKIINSEMEVDSSRTGTRDNSSESKSYAAKIEKEFAVKRYVLLETEFHQDAHHHTQRALADLTEQLANDLKVSWSQA